MEADNCTMKSNIPGIELISGKVTATSATKQEFTVGLADGQSRVIFVPTKDKIPHIMHDIRVGVQVIIHQTKSGPKSIAIMPTTEIQTPDDVQRVESQMIGQLKVLMSSGMLP